MADAIVRRSDSERKAYVQGYAAGAKFVLSYWRTGSQDGRERVEDMLRAFLANAERMDGGER